MTKTDVGRNFKRERELIEAQGLDAAIRMFINRWSPEDGPRDFEADFVHIVQRIYHEAQAPFIKAAADAMACVPMTPMFVHATDPEQKLSLVFVNSSSPNSAKR